MKRKFIALSLVFVLIFLSATLITSCGQEAKKVNQNLQEEADNFNIFRRLVVVNTESDKILFEVDGFMSIETKSSKLYITVECGDGVYKKHIIGINNHTTFVMEDLKGAVVDKYHYEIHYHSEGDIIPFKFKKID